MWHERLTEKQRLFVEAYLGEAKGNGTAAARSAGYANPRQSATENLAKPYISEALEAYRSELIESGDYPIVDAMRIHREWLELLDDPETTRTQKINLLRDAARANSMFTENYKIEDNRDSPRQLVMTETTPWDQEGISPEEWVTKQVRE